MKHTASAPPADATTVAVRALLAYFVHEHQDGTATRIKVTLQRSSCTIEDNGRGMGLDRDGYVVGLLEQLAARRSEVALHGIGLAIISMASPEMVFESWRKGLHSTQAFAWGVAQGPVRSEPMEGRTGTRVMLRLPDGAPVIDAEQVLRQVEVWRAAHPGLQIEVVVPGQDVA